MTGYELRVWPIPHSAVSEPLHVEGLDADSDSTAMDYMREYAAELRQDMQVFLYPPGGGRSIASEDGLAEVPA